MKEISFDHMNLTVKDFQESLAWYQRVFGFELVEKGVDENKNPWGIIRNGNSMLCLYEDKEASLPRIGHPEHDKLHRIYHFGIRVSDKAAWEEKIAQEKIPIQYGGSVRYPHSTSWYIEDPTGYEIEVSYWDENKIRF